MFIASVQVVVGGCEEVSLTCAGSGMVVVHSATFLPLEGDCEQVNDTIIESGVVVAVNF